MRFLLILILSMMVSCGPSREEIQARENRRADSIRSRTAAFSLEYPDSIRRTYCDNAHFIIGVYLVNSCEYIAFVPVDRSQGEGVAVVHAGNCNNPIHSQPGKIQEETIKRQSKASPY